MTVSQMASTSAAGPSTPIKPVYSSYPFVSTPPPTAALDEAAVVKGLKDVLRGTSANIIPREDDKFTPASKIYNGAIQCYAYAIVQPRNAEHVSKTIKFCRQHDIHVSVKGGGTGVHGRSLAGHIVLDLILLSDIAIDLPRSGPTLHESFDARVADTARPSADGSGSSKGPDPVRKRSATDAIGLEGDMGDHGRQRVDKNGDIEMLSPTEMTTPPSMIYSRDSSSTIYSRDSSSTIYSRTSSTPATSNQSEASYTAKSSRTSSDPSMRPPPSRTTYVNPSPTASSSFPYVPTSYGGSSSSASQYPASFTNPMISGQQLVLNTNPDAPPYTIVTFGTGVHSKQLDKATAVSPYGSFHVPTSAFPVGAGQFLLGGFGFLGRKHGMAMDNVVEAEVVLADGRIVWLGAEGHQGEFLEGEDPEDLWWAIRGAGPSFGVVTRLRAKAYYIPSVYAGNFIYAFNPATTPSLIRHVRDCVKGSPRSLYANLIMTAGPIGTPAIVAIQLCFSGPRSEGETYVQAIGSWRDDRCLFQDFSERTFSRQQLAVEEVLKDGNGRKWYIKSDMLSSLSDEVIDKTCRLFPGVPDGCTWLFEYTGGGAINDVKESCYPSSHRDSQFTVAALHQWSHTEPRPLDETCVKTAEEWINEVIHPNSAGGPLPCFIQSPDEVPGAYGENWSKLQKAKRTFDPDHFFRHSMWPAPNTATDIKKNKGKQPVRDETSASSTETNNATAEVDRDHNESSRRTELPDKNTFLTEQVVVPTLATSAPDPNLTGAVLNGMGMGLEDGLAKNREDALRATPLSGVQEHRANVPSENMGLEETIRAAASSS